MFQFYNPNPAGRISVGDCAVRALTKVLGVDWEKAYALLVKNGFEMADMPSSNAVIDSVLRQHGFYRQNVPNTCPDCLTIKEFCYKNPVGTYLVGTGNHVVAIVNGTYFDSWPSGDETIMYFWTK